GCFEVIQLKPITTHRSVTFTKRKFGLMKKAYELSVLCDCEIALIIFNHSNKLFQYASTDMDKVLLKYTEYNEPHESRTNADIIETLRKKGFNGCNSPEPDGDDSIDQSPLNDRKTEDLDSLFKRYGSTVPQPTFPMPVTVPVTNQNAATALQFSNNPAGALVTTTSFVTSTLTDPRLLSPQQQPLQRNTVSPGLPQRPASAGAMLGGDLGNSNGACPSPVPNGYISARASPGLLSVSNGNSLGKVVPAKSPPPPSPQLVNSRKPDLRVITSQSGKSLLQLTEEELELVSENAQRLGSSQVTQPLTTPVVSVATPSLLAPFPGMQTAYNTEYHLTSADLTALQTFTPPGLVPGNMAAWSVGPVPQSTALTVNTNPNVNIKSEPVSPNRDRSTPSSTGGPVLGAGPQIQGQGLVSIAFPGTQGRSPVDSLSSNGSSYEGSDRDDGAQGRGGGQDFHHQAAAGAQQSTMVLLRPSSAEPQEQDGTNVKRVRLDTWVT
uniref:MADS-box domain-containing protein n=1 Tax=Poecilia mexicana TaxID=48701 RepID=A0A3B3X4M9_9TELE